MPDYKIVHFKDGDKHDFNLLFLPDEILIPLANAIKWENQKRIEKRTAPAFRQERLIQNERYIQHCNATGEIPKQLFLDM